MPKHLQETPSKMPMRARVSVETAENGFVLNSYHNDESKTMVAKNMDEMMGMMHEILGMKQSPKMTQNNKRKMMSSDGHLLVKK